MKPINLSLSKLLDSGKHSDQFKKKNRVHIPNFLDEKSAKKIYHALKSQSEWNLCFNNSGNHIDMNSSEVNEWTKDQKNQLNQIVNGQAKQGFQYLYEAVPIYDIYKNNYLPGHFFNEMYEFFNSSIMIELLKKITGLSEIQFLDMQATKYSASHFLNEHDDNVRGKNRLAAYVLNMTPKWKHEWGGALIFNDGDLSEAMFPSYNALNLFSVPQKHLVSFVSPYVESSRYSITGWLRY